MGWDGTGEGGGATPEALVDRRDAGGRDGLTSDVMFTKRGGRTKFHTWRILWGHYEAKHTACVHARARRKH